ncbi:MAG: HlyD family secretion protein [Candidatus Eremiobacteraeota bacterium]|nr:HlyD family secretion protein [Candidatus Eremiobacteraeota bacterium]
MNTREAEQPTAEASAVHGNGRGTEPLAEDGTKARGGPRKRVVFGIIGVIVAIVLIVLGVKWFLYARLHEGTDDARVDADPVAVTSKISERIDSILVDTNASVKKGQTLIVLDNAVEQAQVNSAQAQFDLATANQRANTTQGQGGVAQAIANTSNAQALVPVAQSGVAQAVAQLHAAQSQLPAAQAAYQRAVADYARTASLVSTGDVPRRDLDAARANEAAAGSQLRIAQDQINVAQANFDAAQQKVGAATASVAAAQGGATTAQGKLQQASDPSQVEVAKAQLAIAKQNLNYTRIVAPVDAYVGEKSAEAGQTIQAGMTLMTLIPTGPGKIFITANFKETQLGSMRVGQPVDIKVDAYKGIVFQGHVASINPASQNTYALVPAQNATGNFVKVTQRIPVRISIDDRRRSMPLRPGMSVEANVKVR